MRVQAIQNLGYTGSICEVEGELNWFGEDPAFTDEEINAEVLRLNNAKKDTDVWDELNLYLSTLTVQRLATATELAGFKFSVDPQSIANISLEIDTMLDTDTRTWYEDWGNATVTRAELQEAKRLASEAKQAKLLELFGA